MKLTFKKVSFFITIWQQVMDKEDQIENHLGKYSKLHMPFMLLHILENQLIFKNVFTDATVFFFLTGRIVTVTRATVAPFVMRMEPSLGV